MDARKVTREELYWQVWTTPMSTLPPKYGLSDVGLAKICRKHQIPRPGRGYWAQLRAGKDPTRADLPKLPDDDGRPILILNRQSGRPVVSQVVAEKAAKEKEPAQQIRVPERLVKPHPEVARAAGILRRANKNDRLLLVNWQTPHLDIKVTKASLPRALRIMDTVLKECQKRGYTVAIIKDTPHRTMLTVIDQEVKLSLEEKVRATKHEPTRQWDWQRWDYHPTGQLQLKIDSVFLSGVRRTWADGKTQRVEDVLNDFMAGLVRAAEVLRKDAEEREERRRQHELEWQRELEERRKRELEKKRAAELERQVDAWIKAKRMRAYVSALAKVESIQLPIDLDITLLSEWIEWARGYADQVDPLRTHV